MTQSKLHSHVTVLCVSELSFLFSVDVCCFEPNYATFGLSFSQAFCLKTIFRQVDIGYAETLNFLPEFMWFYRGSDYVPINHLKAFPFTFYFDYIYFSVGQVLNLSENALSFWLEL